MNICYYIIKNISQNYYLTKESYMFSFNPEKYNYASHRNMVYAKKGMACSTSPLASNTAIEILKKGGNAIDAALAMAVIMPLVEPTSNGLGSDCFVLVWTKGKLYGLNGSGVAPQKLSANIVKKAGFDQVPIDGWMPTMVPGMPSAWAELRKRFGTLSFEEIMKPAISYAEDGVHVQVNVAKMWRKAVERYTLAYNKKPEVFAPWFKLFTKSGKPYEAGDLFVNPEYAATLRELAATDCESYYRGPLMHKILAFSEATGGYFTASDFENYHAQWVEPISTNYKGYDVYEIPPNGHGITVLMALNLLRGLQLDANRESADTYHKTVEAIKLAFADTMKFVADPRFMKTKVEDMLSERYANARRKLIGEKALFPEAGDPSCGGTVYFCTADGEGNMVSFIQSNYQGFGSGIVIPGTAISLQDRGANFSLDPNSDNYLEGGKKSYHTIIPGFLAKDGKPIGPFGVMGAFMQPQGQIEVLLNTIDYHMNPQEALDAPRIQWIKGKHIQLEKAVGTAVTEELKARGHEVEVINDNIDMGRGQIIWRREDGTLCGGTEPRADGSIAVW